MSIFAIEDDVDVQIKEIMDKRSYARDRWKTWSPSRWQQESTLVGKSQI